MKSGTIKFACVLAFAVVLVFSIQRARQWAAIRSVLTAVDERAAFIQTVPKGVTGSERIAVIDRFVKAVGVIDASGAPKDFQVAFDAWKVSWTSLRDKLEGYEVSVLTDSPARKEVKEATARLDELRTKYGFRSGGEGPARSIIGQLIDGVIGFGLGEYMMLLGFGVVGSHKTPEAREIWVHKRGPWMMLCGIILLAQGIYHLFNGFS
jgi:hypothetical protein